MYNSSAHLPCLVLHALYRAGWWNSSTTGCIAQTASESVSEGPSMLRAKTVVAAQSWLGLASLGNAGGALLDGQWNPGCWDHAPRPSFFDSSYRAVIDHPSGMVDVLELGRQIRLRQYLEQMVFQVLYVIGHDELQREWADPFDLDRVAKFCRVDVPNH